MKHFVPTGIHVPQEVRAENEEADWSNDAFQGWFYNTGLTYGEDYRYLRGGFEFREAGRAILFKLTFGGTA